MEVMRRRIRGAFALKAVLTLALVALGDVLFFQNGLFGGTFGLYGLAILAALALARPEVIGQWRAATALGMAALYALAMAYSASPLAWLLFWIAAGLATLLPRTYGFDDGWRWFQRLVFHGLVALLGPIPDILRRAKVRAQRGLGQGGVRRIVPVVILPLVGTLVFVALFSAANPVIEHWLASLSLPQVDERTFLRAILWLVLVWLAWGVMRPHLPPFLFATFDGRGEAYIPGVTPQSVLLSLVAFNALFLVQNAMDAAWLWGLLPLPEGMTLAEYAHRGAYPLVVTALLAAMFVLVALRPGSATANLAPVRALVALWITQNLFLVFNAALRTVDYVEAYSLTVLRIAALLWMGLVALGLVLVLWRILANKSAAWLINANLASAGLLLTALCFVDLGAIAAQWNVRRAREIDGTGATLDLCYLNALGGSALLPLIELEQRDLPADLTRRVHNVRLSVHRRLQTNMLEGGWDWLGKRRLDAAKRLVGESVAPPAGEADFDCNGRPIVYPAPQPTYGADLPEAPAPELTVEEQG